MDTIENTEQIKSNESTSNLPDDTLEEEKKKSSLIADEFSTEMFKLEVRNLPKNFGFGQLRKLFHSLNLKFVKLKAPSNSSYAFVNFVNEEAREEALKILNNYKYKGKLLEAIHAKPSQDALNTFKRRNTHPIEDESLKNSKQSKPENMLSNLSLEEKVQNSTTPLWNLPYEKQIEKKKASLKQILRKSLFKMEKLNKDTFYWLKKQSKAYEGMCCDLVEFVQSPVTDGYRNKCEFTIGYDFSETKNVIGFRLGDFKSGSNEVVEPYCLKNISESMKSLTRKFQEYVDQSKYKPFNVRTREGNWRQVTIRSNQKNEMLAIIVFDKHDLTDEAIDQEKKSIADFFKNEKNNQISELTDAKNSFKLISLLFNLNMNRTGISKMDNLDLLFGVDNLHEYLLDLNFQISPLAFFQANTKGAEILYSKIAEICDIDENTVVLDICCGTGTIGLTIAKKAKLVVGVEIIPEAIEDAKINSKLNNINNVEFHCGKAEEVLPNLLKRFSNERVVAIVDPPRAGLHNKVIQALRHLNNLNTLIYVSCNPELAMGNFIDLSRDTSKTYKLQPFVPIKAIGVDMFPHTTHCELILHFQRYSNELISEPSKTLPQPESSNLILTTENNSV